MWQVYPVNDWIEHDLGEKSDECVCGPTIELVQTDHGDEWLCIHEALDGRE